MKKTLFSQLIAEFPELKGLSAQRFSKLSRFEMYQVAKALREKYADAKEHALRRYNSLSTPDLSKALYNACVEIYK